MWLHSQQIWRWSQRCRVEWHWESLNPAALTLPPTTSCVFTRHQSMGRNITAKKPFAHRYLQRTSLEPWLFTISCLPRRRKEFRKVAPKRNEMKTWSIPHSSATVKFSTLPPVHKLKKSKKKTEEFMCTERWGEWAGSVYKEQTQKKKK